MLHISNFINEPGASRAAFRLHESLLQGGVNSFLLAGQGPTTRQATQIPRGPRVLHALEWRLGRVLMRTGLGDLIVPHSRRLTSHPWFRQADIVHLHKVHGGYFGLSGLLSSHWDKPTCWTLHDMWAITGYCYQSLDCLKWKSSCGDCPQVRNPDETPIQLSNVPLFDTTRLHHKAKQYIYSRARLIVVTPSQWLRGRVMESPLLKSHRTVCIEPGIDTSVFVPRNDGGRRVLGLPENKVVFLLVAPKGVDSALTAFSTLDSRYAERCHLVIVDSALSGAAVGPVTVTHLGRLTEMQMAEYMAAADAHVLPSLADNMPSTAIESISSGTPVVAFAVGGIPEIVKHERTGLLVPAGSLKGLAAAIARLVVDGALLSALSGRCRPEAVTRFDQARFASDHMSLYEEILRGNSQARRVSGGAP